MFFGPGNKEAHERARRMHSEGTTREKRDAMVESMVMTLGWVEKFVGLLKEHEQELWDDVNISREYLTGGEESDPAYEKLMFTLYLTGPESGIGRFSHELQKLFPPNIAKQEEELRRAIDEISMLGNRYQELADLVLTNSASDYTEEADAAWDKYMETIQLAQERLLDVRVAAVYRLKAAVKNLATCLSLVRAYKQNNFQQVYEFLKKDYGIQAAEVASVEAVKPWAVEVYIPEDVYNRVDERSKDNTHSAGMAMVGKATYLIRGMPEGARPSARHRSGTKKHEQVHLLTIFNPESFFNGEHGWLAYDTEQIVRDIRAAKTLSRVFDVYTPNDLLDCTWPECVAHAIGDPINADIMEDERIALRGLSEAGGYGSAHKNLGKVAKALDKLKESDSDHEKEIEALKNELRLRFWTIIRNQTEWLHILEELEPRIDGARQRFFAASVILRPSQYRHMRVLTERVYGKEAVVEAEMVVKAYPTRDWLGLVEARLGRGEAPWSPERLPRIQSALDVTASDPNTWYDNSGITDLAGYRRWKQALEALPSPIREHEAVERMVSYGLFRLTNKLLQQDLVNGWKGFFADCFGQATTEERAEIAYAVENYINDDLAMDLDEAEIKPRDFLRNLPWERLRDLGLDKEVTKAVS